MTKTTLLVAVLTVVTSGAVASAQVYVQPANYAYASNGYVASQPAYAPAYTTPAYTAPAYATPTYTTSMPYTPAAYTPTTTYYAGNACGQVVPCRYSCSSPCACNPCACTPCATTYAPQAVYSPVTYAAPAPMACGPQACIRRGLLGQPTVYVPGQPVRNLFRFLTP